MTGRDNAERQRYELVVEDEVVCIVDYAVRADGAVVLRHVETDPAHRGQGRAAELMTYVLDELRAEGRRVVPRCPYAVSFMAEHPDYDDLRAPE